MPITALLCMLTTALLLFITPAWAATPLVTDDPETLGTGKGQFEICGRFGFDRDVTDGIATTSRSTQFTGSLTYGVAEPLDLVLEFSRAWGTASTEGVDIATPDSADFKLSVKYKLLEAGGFVVALRPDLGYSYIPAGSSRDNAPSWGGTLIVGRQFKPVTFNANFGYMHYNYQAEADKAGLRPDLWSASISASWQLLDSLQLVADIGTGTNPDRASTTMPTFSCAGLIYSLNEAFDLAVGTKFGLNKPETDVTAQSAIVFKF